MLSFALYYTGQPWRETGKWRAHKDAPLGPEKLQTKLYLDSDFIFFFRKESRERID